MRLIHLADCHTLTFIRRIDFLLYGRLYAPSPRLDALYIHRLTPTLQTLVSLITVPSPIASPQLTWQSPEDPASPPTAPNPPPSSERLSELEVKLMQDTGRWSAEYSYAVGDGMWGARGLYNFGKWGGGAAVAAAAAAAAASSGGTYEDASGRERVVDEEEELSTGLKGRWSAGGEVFFSAQERSGGVSTALRFSTLPESTTPYHGTPPQPPTVITATLNPIMGQLSTAYSVGVNTDTALASRFDFNLYSYDAELTFGGEWFQRRKRRPLLGDVDEGKTEKELPPTFDAFGREHEGESRVEKGAKLPMLPKKEEDEVIGVLKMRASTNTVRLRPRRFFLSLAHPLLHHRTSLYYGKDDWATSSSLRALWPTCDWQVSEEGGSVRFEVWEWAFSIGARGLR